MKKVGKYLIVLTIILSLFGCKVKNNDLLDGPYLVERVVDGDTFITRIDDERVRVRALCIDTPESVAPEETVETHVYLPASFTFTVYSVQSPTAV